MDDFGQKKQDGDEILRDGGMAGSENTAKDIAEEKQRETFTEPAEDNMPDAANDSNGENQQLPPQPDLNQQQQQAPWQQAEQKPQTPENWQQQEQNPQMPGNWQQQGQEPQAPGNWQQQGQGPQMPGNWQQGQGPQTPGNWQQQGQNPQMPNPNYPQGGSAPNPYYQAPPQGYYYGQPGGQPQPASPPPKQPANNMAVTSMVLGIVSLLVSCCCFPVGFIIGFALGMGGLVLAVLSKKGKPFSGYAIAGLVLSILGICGSLFIFICYVITANLMKDPEYAALFNEILRQYYNGN